ncbi:hypothetical protein F8388_004103 [Cannabis sativa]|uniref:Uncharacterized protein n=1 Tax=Cannabis sativa TaxID=3483 RepID=A0A7J6G987_CANSA|nr:hypothetical protein G4B88_008649 [Cannabis sativa]KAF4348863.1 hypothetical protein F8388_025148 [Cannabis sativa]KAF4372893.1 hypothetical protein F8388_004103 [Cannabis sativa]KAF4379536.1 hypothetical protein G4B88_028778 [Cannabis sativa]
MATNSNSRANPSWEAMDFAFLRNFVVKFSNCSTSLNPSRVMFDVNMDESKVDEIYENKRSFYLRHSWPPLRTLKWKPNCFEQITAAWTWESWSGVKMNWGFGTEGSKNLRLVGVDPRTEVNDDVLGVKIVVTTGTESSELIETHSIKFLAVLELAEVANE